MKQPEGRVALITGASRGIGAAVARALGEAGFAVIVNYLQAQERAEEVVAHIISPGGRAIAVRADVRDPTSVRAMVDAAIEAFGSIDVLVNGAINALPLKPFSELTWEDFNSLIDIQVRGAVNCCQAVLPLMERRGRGSIINILASSVVGTPPMRSAAYVTAKSALFGLSKSLAVEYAGRGIRVNMVAPSSADTELLSILPSRAREIMAAQHPMKRLATPDDVARAVLFLASDASEYISGANLLVTGGQVII